MKQRVIWAVLFEAKDFGLDWIQCVSAHLTRKKARATAEALPKGPGAIRNVRVVRFQASPGQGLRAYR